MIYLAKADAEVSSYCLTKVNVKVSPYYSLKSDSNYYTYFLTSASNSS